MTTPLERTHTQSAKPRRDAFVAGRDVHVHLSGHRSDQHGQSTHPTDPSYYERHRPIFVQYLNPEILAYYGIGSNSQAAHAAGAALHATRLAILATDGNLVFPASYFFEVPGFLVFLDQVDDLVRAGQICYTAPVADLAAYREAKEVEYRGEHRSPYRTAVPIPPVSTAIAWRPRYQGSTATGISELWQDALRPDGDLAVVVQGLAQRWSRGHGRGDIEEVLHQTPERLDGHAFVQRFVENTIPINLRPGESTRIALIISRAYLISYLAELNALMLVDFAFGDLSCGLGAVRPELSRRLLSARRLDTVLHWSGLYGFVHRGAHWRDLVALRGRAEFGLVALATYDVRHTEQLLRAVARVRRLSRFDMASNLREAELRISAIAAEIDATGTFRDP